MALDLLTLVSYVKRAGGTALHLSAGAQPMGRIQGDLRLLESEEDLSDKERVLQLIHGVLSEAQKRRLDAERDLDFTLPLSDGDRLRVSVFHQDRGLAAALRVMPGRVPTFEELGLPPVAQELAALTSGLVVVTGPAGCGKSSTLAAIVDELNRVRKGHVVTIEDPIEFVFKPKKCMVNQREVGTHAASFAAGLRSATREDADAVLVGELRDAETLGLALAAADRGRLVLAAMPTATVARTVGRLLEGCPAEERGSARELVASALQAVVAQKLLPKVGGGRVAAHEVLVATATSRAAIRAGRLQELGAIIERGSNLGMQTMEAGVDYLLHQGWITEATARDALADLAAR